MAALSADANPFESGRLDPMIRVFAMDEGWVGTIRNTQMPLAEDGETFYELDNSRFIGQVQAEALDRMADIIVDRYMPMCQAANCTECDPARFQVIDTLRRLLKATNTEADRLRREGTV
jgi:hypothetical protein